jgi:hypothetical protein
MKKTSVIISILLVILIAVGIVYWYLFMRTPAITVVGPSSNSSGGFSPLNGNSPLGNSGSNPGNGSANSSSTTNTSMQPAAKIPTLRLLSNTPVGGYGASTVGTTTRVRWVDRGRGNIYEVVENIPTTATLSNTIVPRVNESAWNSNLSAFIGSLVQDGASRPVTVLSSLLPRPAASTSTRAISSSSDPYTPFQLKGSNLPDNVVTYAVSPKKDKVFLFINENGVGTGYIANFNGSSMKRLFTTPLTQVIADWPETNTITLLTQASASDNGFFYFVSTQTGAMRKVLGPIPGLLARASHDAKYVIYSGFDLNQNVSTAILTVAKNVSTDALIQTLANKCAWGNFYKNLVYCGVPRTIPEGTYPDDWLMGLTSFSDKIWQFNAETGEAHLVSTIVDQSDRIIDAFNLGLDEKDNYLFFMNKNDLSLWSLDLVSAN